MRCGGQQRCIWQVELRLRSSVAALCCRWLQEEELLLLGRWRRCPRLARCLVASVWLRCACLVLCGGLHCASALCFSCVWAVSGAPFWRALGMDWCEAWRVCCLSLYSLVRFCWIGCDPDLWCVSIVGIWICGLVHGTSPRQTLELLPLLRSGLARILQLRPSACDSAVSGRTAQRCAREIREKLAPGLHGPGSHGMTADS